MSSYRELIVWKKAFKLTLLLYKTTSSFPKSEMYSLTSQMRRAALGIISNIAEGNARRHRKEYIQFLSVAYGSAAELEVQLLLVKELKYVTNSTYKSFSELLTEIMKMLNKLMSSLKTTPKA